MSDTKQKKTRTPRNYENILKGALTLPLKERVDLVKVVKESIESEVSTMEAAAKEALSIVNGL